MGSLPFNAVDIIVLGIVVVSGLLAFARGLVREVLAIVGWVGAAIITLYGIPYIRPYIGLFVHQEQIILDVIGGTFIFIVTLVALSLAGVGIARQISDSELSALDRSLGFVFGVARGMVLICLSYIVIIWALPPADHPRALRDARTLPLIDMGKELLTGLMPDSWRGNTARRSEEMRRDAEAEAKRIRDEAYKALIAPQVKPTAAAPRDTQGYSDKQRQVLDNLLEGNKGTTK